VRLPRDERAADLAGDGAGAVRRPAHIHVHPLPAALPGVRVPPPVRGRARLCSRLPAINARHRTRTRYQHRPSWKVPEDPPPSSPTSVMAMGLPSLHCCRLPAHGSLTPLCAALARRPLPQTSALRYSSLEAQGILTHLCFIISCVLNFLLPLRCWSTECLTLKRPVQISCFLLVLNYRSFKLLLTARDTIEEEVLRMFLKERQLHDDFVTKISDMVWRRNGGNVDAVEATTDQGSAIEVAQPEDVSSANHDVCIFEFNNNKD
jgi:hypothetical protein